MAVNSRLLVETMIPADTCHHQQHCSPSLRDDGIKKCGTKVRTVLQSYIIIPIMSCIRHIWSMSWTYYLIDIYIFCNHYSHTLMLRSALLLIIDHKPNDIYRWREIVP